MSKANPVERRSAGGEYHDGLSLCSGGLDPARYFAKGAAHVMHRDVVAQMWTHQRQRAASADDDIRSAKAITRGIGEPGPAVIEYAQQDAVRLTFRQAHSPRRGLSVDLQNRRPVR